MRAILSPSALFALFDAADHARRARLVFQWAAERLLNEVQACAEGDHFRIVEDANGLGALYYGFHAEVADWLRDGGGFAVRPLDG